MEKKEGIQKEVKATEKTNKQKETNDKEKKMLNTFSRLKIVFIFGSIKH